MAEVPTLAELQARFQAALTSGDEGILDLIPANSRTSNAVLLGVYRHAYVARLIEVVRGAYPLLAQHLGDAAFEAMARGYVARFPSHHTNARWYAGRVPEFLEEAPYSATPELAEIAHIERQLDLAFDAADAPVLDLTGLSAHPPEVWGSLVFVPHPSAALLSCATNAFDLWLALKNGALPPAVRREPEPQRFLVWRQDSVPRIRKIVTEEWMLWREAARGATFGALNEMAAVYAEPDTAALRVAQYLQGWLGTGLLSSVTAAPEPARV